MATYPVKWYSSNMQGAPSLGDTTDGALTALLKAVLVTGFGTLSVSTLVWDPEANAAVATVGTHSYLKDSIIAVSGASPSAYNGEHRVTKVSATKVWFELSAGDPSADASGSMSIKVAPLGWTLTHESADQKVAIYRPTDISASGNVSLRIDNTAWSGWTGFDPANYPMYTAKVQMVESVIDINTYTLITEYRWPCTKRYSDGRWDFIGDSQLFYHMPAFAIHNLQHTYVFGYIRSIRAGDRYHAVLNGYNYVANDLYSSWSSSQTNFGSTLPVIDDTSLRSVARAYTQMFGSVSWWSKGYFSRVGTGLSTPNGPDNGVHLLTDSVPIMETGSHVRGYLPGLITPLNTVAGWYRSNYRDIPAVLGKIIRFVGVSWSANGNNGATMVCFDLTGPWR